MKTFCATGINKDSDEALVATAKRGDTRAFEELVLRYKHRVLAVAQRITKNREDAEDVAQETFLKAFLHRDDFQQKSRFSTWLTRIAMNQAFMLLRRKRGFFEVLPENPDDGGKCSSEPFVDQSPNPEESCWRRERMDLLTKAIHRLSPIVGRTIVLRDIEERSAKETAKILGTTISAVKARGFHGRRKLRRTVSPGLLRGGYKYGQAEAQRC
jgi:RNA polymerase sigma-70 factor (ECF subfamily)